MSDSAALLSEDTRPAPTSSAPSRQSQGNGNGSGNGNGHAAGADDDPLATADGKPVWWQDFGKGLDKSEAMSWRNTASRYDSPQSFVKSHIELRKSAIFLPKDDKPEAWDQIYQKLGKPADPKEYEFDFGDVPLDDTDKEIAEQFKPIAHSADLTKQQVKKLTKWQAEVKKAQTDAAIARADKLAEERAKALRTEWGNSFEANRSAMNQAIKGAADKQELATLARLRLDDGTFAMDHPALAKVISRLGSRLAEDDRDPSVFNASAREGAIAERNRIESEAIAKGLSPVHPLWPHDELKRLEGRISGTRPMSIGSARAGFG